MASQGFGFATPNKAGTRGPRRFHSRVRRGLGGGLVRVVSGVERSTDKVIPPLLLKNIFIEHLLCS